MSYLFIQLQYTKFLDFRSCEPGMKPKFNNLTCHSSFISETMNLKLPSGVVFQLIIPLWWCFHHPSILDLFHPRTDRSVHSAIMWPWNEVKRQNVEFIIISQFHYFQRWPFENFFPICKWNRSLKTLHIFKELYETINYFVFYFHQINLQLHIFTCSFERWWKSCRMIH